MASHVSNQECFGMNCDRSHADRRFRFDPVGVCWGRGASVCSEQSIEDGLV